MKTNLKLGVLNWIFGLMASLVLCFVHPAFAGDGGDAAAGLSSSENPSDKLIGLKPGVGSQKNLMDKSCVEPGEGAAKLCSEMLTEFEGKLGQFVCADSGGASDIHNTAERASVLRECGSEMRKRSISECAKQMSVCVKGCEKTESEYQKRMQTAQKSELADIIQNKNRARDNVELCQSYFRSKLSLLSASHGEMIAGQQQAQNVADATQSRNSPSNFGGPLGGGAAPPGAGDASKESGGMSPWLVGGIGAAVGGLAGYMIGNNQGEKEGFKEGKQAAEEEAKKKAEEGVVDENGNVDTDGDGVADTDCNKAESAKIEQCRDIFYAKCDSNPEADGCVEFTDAYCKNSQITPDATFCRKLTATNYCANNDSYNKNNCPSCRELANGFNGQYTPEDLANACTVCSNDPMCGSGSTAYAYQTNPGSGAGGGTTGGSTTPASSGNPFGRGVIDVGGGSNSESQSLSSTSSSSTSSTMSGPLGVASGSGQAVVGANEYGIASAHGQSNFRIHSAIIQRSCEQGQMVGCGPLAGLSRGAGGASGTGGVR